MSQKKREPGQVKMLITTDEGISLRKEGEGVFTIHTNMRGEVLSVSVSAAERLVELLQPIIEEVRGREKGRKTR